MSPQYLPKKKDSREVGRDDGLISRKKIKNKTRICIGLGGGGGGGMVLMNPRNSFVSPVQEPSSGPVLLAKSKLPKLVSSSEMFTLFLFWIPSKTNKSAERSGSHLNPYKSTQIYALVQSSC